MFESAVLIGFIVVLSSPPERAVEGRVPSTHTRSAFRDHLDRAPQQATAAPRHQDSLKNGAITGAVAGALAGAVLAGVGCSVGDALGESPESNCIRGTVILMGIGTGLGALIGIGIDALFEQGPSPVMPLGGRRVGVRLTWRF